ncbi:MAG: hypothetical protein GY811_04450 [Myxococcales bacterium]|nr:hypothetical protein [Myxococcales bacterium]
MKTGYRTIVRRRVEASRRIRRPNHGTGDARSALQPLLDDPMEMGSELVNLVTGELVQVKKETIR